MKRKKLPIALTVAGSDSGGGAGLQADLKTFAALGVHGATAITCLTAQNPAGVAGIQAATTDMVRLQLAAVFAELPPAAVKTGMLYSREIIREVARFFGGRREVPLVVDPVMVATSGARLLEPAAEAALREELLPIAWLATPNLAEAEVLLGHPIASVEELRAAAREFHGRYGCGALVKGGHLRDTPQAVDFYYDGKVELMLQAPFIRGVATHGTGCTCSAAIAAWLALGRELPQAVEKAKHYISQAISQSVGVAAHTALNHFWKK